MDYKLLKNLFDSDNVEVADQKAAEEKISNIIQGGPSKLQFIVDFDYTLSRAHKEGKPVDCSWGVFENYHELPSDYHQKVKSVRDKYYPIEIDVTISLEKKIPLMIEWYKEANKLLAESKVKSSWFPSMVKESNCELRDGTNTLLNKLHEVNIPVLVLSAGLGNLIEEIMTHFGVLNDNTTLISNFLEFDSDGVVVGLKDDENLIHMYNKSDIIGKKSQGDNFKNRKNVIVMGDSLGDLKMADGVVDPEEILTIGFLNKNISESLEVYKQNFDIVLVDDQSMNFPNSLLSELLR